MWILLTVCLMGAPDNCREERISWSMDTRDSMACLLHAQETIAQWQSAHLQWKVRNWRCVTKRGLSTDI